MLLNPYLAFNGQCEEAFRFYEKCLGGKITAMFPHEGTPAASSVPAEWQKKIMHACLETGGQRLMGGDAPPGHFSKPQGFCVSLGVNTTADAERIFGALSTNGKVQMPLGKTFFAARFGMLIDQYGTPWMVICEKEA